LIFLNKNEKPLANFVGPKFYPHKLYHPVHILAICLKMKRQKKSGNDNSQTGGKKWFLIIMLSILGIAVGCYFLVPDFKAGVNEAFDILTSDDQDEIQRWVRQFGILGPIVLILAMAFQMFLLVVPNILLFAIAIVCYGPVWGPLICLIGVFCSSSLGYFIGKKLGARAIDRFVSQRIQHRIQVIIERYGIKAVVIFRLSTISADSLGFIAGILEMNYRKYIIATMCGVAPLITLVAIYGSNGKLESALFWVAGISLACLIVYYFFDKKGRKEAFAKGDKEYAADNSVKEKKHHTTQSVSKSTSDAGSSSSAHTLSLRKPIHKSKSPS
jgi:uncharacterized membrane protein YdjX (TVP38/TMEM64 family)